MNPSTMRAFLVNLYNTYRTERMNHLYYGWRLARLQRFNRRFEIAVAMGSSIPIGAWAIWKVGPGELAWALLSGLAVLLAAVKPILNMGPRLERYGRLFAGHGDVYFDLQSVVQDIAVNRSVSDEQVRVLTACRERARKMAPDDEPLPNSKLLRKAFDEVNRMIRPQDFWMP